jgi:hypothetical protein
MQRIAQTCIDMKVQHHINKREISGMGTQSKDWYRCKRVDFVGETAIWELRRTSGYSFLEAYKMTPHRQLIQAIDDNALQVFVKAWGPLRRFSLNDWSGIDPIETYREERDRLTAISRLLASVGQPEMQRSALLGFWKISSKVDSIPKTLLETLQTRLPMACDVHLSFDENLQRWVDTLTQEQIEAATTWTISDFPPLGLNPRFTVERSRGGNALRASPGIHTLGDALDWMVWQDVVQNHPIQFCVECRGLIDFKGHHTKRFCSPECAHRKTGREWQQRKREKERKTDGTKKAQ